MFLPIPISSFLFTFVTIFHTFFLAKLRTYLLDKLIISLLSFRIFCFLMRKICNFLFILLVQISAYLSVFIFYLKYFPMYPLSCFSVLCYMQQVHHSIVSMTKSCFQSLFSISGAVLSNFLFTAYPFRAYGSTRKWPLCRGLEFDHFDLNSSIINLKFG